MTYVEAELGLHSFVTINAAAGLGGMSYFFPVGCALGCLLGTKLVLPSLDFALLEGHTLGTPMRPLCSLPFASTLLLVLQLCLTGGTPTDDEPDVPFWAFLLF